MFKFSPIQRFFIPFMAAVLVIFGAAPVAAAAPGAVVGLDVTAGTDSVSASWTPPTDDGGVGIDEYEVTLSGSASDSTTVTVTNASFTGLGVGDYTITVSAVNTDGTGPGSSGSATIATTPSVPANITADVSGQSVTVSWTGSADDGGDPDILYLVSFGVESGDTESTQITFNDVAPGSYVAEVRASNTGGTSAAGQSASFTVDSPVSAPSAPSGVLVDVSGQSVTVSWTGSADDGGDSNITYDVSFGSEFGSTQGTSSSFPDVTPGTYTASVTARNSGGTSAAGQSASFTVDSPVSAPSAPSGVLVDVSGQSVTVSWTGSADDGGDSNITYDVSFGSEFGSTQGTSSSFPDVTPGTYTASVTARNSGGTSAAGQSASFTVDSPVSAPSAPTGVLVDVSGQSVTVSWTGSADDGGDPDILYLVSFGAESGDTESTQITFNDVAPGSYVAEVRASNTGGTSAAGQSASFPVDAPIGTPSAPQGPSATVADQTVTVSWSAPADDGGDPNITYEITLGALTPQSTTGTSVSFSDVPAGSYTATITASNLAGEGGSANTNSVTVQAPAALPGTPSDLTATATGLGVAVSWIAPADNGSPITGYQVNLNGSVSTVSSSPASFPNLSPGTYTVTVAAINGVGTGNAAGPESFTIEVPIVPPGVPGSVTASVSGQTVSVSWNRPDDGGDPALSYTVSLSNGASQTVSTISAEFAVGAGNYTASVTATNSAGPGPTGTSLEFSVFSTPSAPRNLAAAADGSSVIATWAPPASNGNLTLTGYSIRLELNGSVLETQDVGAETSSVRFDGRSPAIYTVVVSARNGQGLGAGAAVNVEVGSTAPSAPTNVSGSANFQTVTITWDPPLSVGNTALTGYEVTVGTVVETVSSGTRSVVLADIEPGTYVAQVRAINSGGKSLAGESSSFKAETVFSPFDSAEDLLTQQYADFLGRPPDPAGLAYWKGILGADRNEGPILIESFMISPEFRPRRAIARLYLAFFDRSPDRAGFDYWTGGVRNGGGSTTSRPTSPTPTSSGTPTAT